MLTHPKYQFYTALIVCGLLVLLMLATQTKPNIPITALMLLALVATYRRYKAQA